MCLTPASDHIPVNTEDDVEFEGDNGEVGEGSAMVRKLKAI